MEGRCRCGPEGTAEQVDIDRDDLVGRTGRGIVGLCRLLRPMAAARAKANDTDFDGSHSFALGWRGCGVVMPVCGGVGRAAPADRRTDIIGMFRL